MRRLVSWPIALACARERAALGPLWALGGMMAIAALWFADPNRAGADLFGGTSFGEIFLLFFSLFLGAGLIADELETGHAQLVLLRPVTRAEWFGGRLCGAGLVMAAAMAVAWLLALGGSLRAGAGFHWARLLALPVGFAFAFSWLATLAAISVVARGWTNTGWVMLGALGWFLLWAAAGAASAVKRLAQQGGGVAERIVELVRAVHPYLGPRDPTALILALQSGERVDPWPLLWDLAWTAAAWMVGVALLRKRELARRRA